MDNFQRAREAPTKKPRLSEDQPKHSGRAFFQKPSQSQLARYRAENNDASHEGTYQPQVQQFHELVSQYKNALSELTFNSKPIITNLTIIAGENLHAAKSIAATVCANIREVPSEQKLPSLYLLDSIVKNIGRDYIKYFAARLPEVFCNSYRQVDPSVLPSMRHLFGTWRGVFSSQPLQAIEKELGFTSSVNASSSGAAMSNVDSQSKRPPHSIHVNPKYLEKQRLQQSSQGKGMKNEVAVPISTFSDEMDKPNRKASIGGKDWSEVPRSMHSYGEAPCESKFGTSTSHRDSEYGSDVSRNSDMGIGRTGRRAVEHGLDRHGYQVESDDAKAKAGQINGFERKNEYLNHVESRFAKADLHQDPTQISERGGSGLSSSWWSSEEEFKWETLPGMPDQGASNLLSTARKSMIAGDSMKMGNMDVDVGMPSDPACIDHVEAVRHGHRLSPSGVSGAKARQRIRPLSSSSPPCQSPTQQDRPSLAGSSFKPSHRHHFPQPQALEDGALRSSALGSRGVLRSSLQDHCDQFSSGTSPSSSTGSLHVPAALSGSAAVSASLSAPSAACSRAAAAGASRTEPPLPLGPPPAPHSSDKTNHSSTSFSDLLGSLLSKGLISASSPEASLAAKPPAVEEPSFLEPEPKSRSASPEKAAGEAENHLIGSEFKSDLIREPHPNVIDALTRGLLHQCGICGIRLKLTDQLEKHLRSHACREQRLDGLSKSKDWYVGVRKWIARNAEVPPEPEPVEGGELMVPADEGQCACLVCGEVFEDYYCVEKSRWMFVGAVYVNAPSGDDPGSNPNERARGIIVHSGCMSESFIQDFLGFSSERF